MSVSPRCLPHRLAGCLLGLAATLLPAAEAGAWLRRVAPFEATTVETMHVAPLAMPGQAVAGAALPALLSTPPGWSPGDAAVVLLPEAYPGTAEHNRLVDSLLAEGAAVLEIDPEAGRGLSPEGAAAPVPASTEEALADLFGALAALRRHPGAGTVVLIGLGQAAPQVLPAADPVAGARLPPGMAGYAAVLALGGGDGAAFVPGTPPPLAERWAQRVPLLCEVVAWAVAGSAAAGERMRRMARGCTEALLAPPAAASAAADVAAAPDPALRQVADGAR